MTRRLSRTTLRIIVTGLVLIAALALALFAGRRTGGLSATPLDDKEIAAVVAEIQAMVKTDESEVTRFVAREATPERIDALYRLPELTRLPKNIRENGLIFAGRGATSLSFDRPSDVVARVASWFPDEIARARGSKDQRLWRGDIHLWGPFENWDPEPAAFLALWNCTPQSAWLRPDRNPFERRLNDSIPLYPIAALQSSEQEFDFGFCVRNRNGYRSGRTMDELRANEEQLRAMAERITPVLVGKFSHFLAENRCHGTGPDDCVLVLRQWASLVPGDAGLAAAMQALEPDVAPDGPLPALRNPDAAWGDSVVDDGQDRFDQGLRRAAFLRAKLLSVLNAPQAWPSGSLATTLHQMTRLRQTFAVPFVHRWYQYELDYRNDPVNPWRVLPSTPAQAAQVRTAILEELGRLADGTDCEVFKQWFDHGARSLQSLHVVDRLADKRPLHCAAPDWEWLQQDNDDEARDTRDRYLALLGHLSGNDQDMLLTGFSAGGSRCFEGNPAPPAWLKDVCRTWISEPQAARRRLKHSGLTLNRQTAFRATPARPLPASVLAQHDGALAEQESWLASLAPDVAADAKDALRQIAAEFSRRQVWIYAARSWRHPRSEKSLIELQTGTTQQETEPAWPFGGQRYLLVVDPQSVTLAGIPGRFSYQYDEGEITNVSDLDRDGNLEVWLTGTFGECDGDDPQPGIDCAIETVHMGEIRDDALTYFADTRPAGESRKSAAAGRGLAGRRDRAR